MVNFGHLLIDMPFKILHVEKISVNAKLNHHAKFYMEALIEEEKSEEYINTRNDDMEVKVSTKDQVIFVGRVIETSVLYRNGIALFKIQAISYTYDMDIKVRNRAFMNTSTTYHEVVKTIMESYTNSSYYSNINKEQTINQLLVQYEETDWEFMKRLASHLKTAIVVSYKEKTIRFYLGLPNMESDRKLSTEVNEDTTDLLTYYHVKESSTKKVSRESFERRSVESNEYIPLGIRINLREESYVVSEINMESRRGEIVYNYQLCRPEGIKVASKRNSKMKGVSLEAIVKKRKSNRIQVKFCMNERYEENVQNSWFPYVSEVGNIYTIPEEGSKVHIYFPSSNEKHAYATHCLFIANEKATNYSKIMNPQNKSFSTAQGQELFMNSDEIKVSGNESNSVQVSLGRNGTVSINGSSITLQSDGIFQLGREKEYDPKTNAGKVKTIDISAKNEIMVSKSACQLIQMNNETHFYGLIKFME